MGKVHTYRIEVQTIPKWVDEWVKEKAERKTRMQEQCKELKRLHATK
jgi:hypothetical protein